MRWTTVVGFDADTRKVNISHPPELRLAPLDGMSRADRIRLLDNDVVVLTIGLLTATKSGQDLGFFSQRQAMEQAIEYFKHNIPKADKVEIPIIDGGLRGNNNISTWALLSEYDDGIEKAYCNFAHDRVCQIKKGSFGDFPDSEKLRIIENDINTLCMGLFAVAHIGHERGLIAVDKTLYNIIEIIDLNMPVIDVVGGDLKDNLKSYETVIKNKTNSLTEWDKKNSGLN